MSLLVKICGMRDESAIGAAVESGADAVGFVFFDKSPRNVEPEQAAALAAAVPRGVLKVAVTLHPDAALWNEVQRALRPDVLQTDLEDFAYLDVNPGIEKWPVLREGSLPGEIPGSFVYEGRKSGQGLAVDWKSAAAIATRGRMILAGGLSVDNVAEAIATVRPWGVDVSSAVESSPGVKDAAKIMEFVAAARAAEQSLRE
jgi:phosphoribosylanthranilate isomerase